MSSIKKNTLAVALVAGLGLAGVASAYTYGTVKSPEGPGDLATPEAVPYQVLVAGNGYDYVMAEDLVWDIEIGDNIIGITTGFTVRMTLQNGAAFDATVPILPADLILNPSMVTNGWTVAFDGYYNSNTTVVFRIIPPAPSAPGYGSQVSAGRLLSWNNAALTSLNELAAGSAGGGVDLVNGEFWMVNSTNDAEFVTSRKVAPILSRNSAITACANSNSAEVNKYIDVADNFNESVIPKTRFSPDGKLGSSGDGSTLDQTWIDLGDVTITSAGAPFANQLTDQYVTVIEAGAGNDWNAFENGGPAYTDDVYLKSGSCSSGAIVAQGWVQGSTVTFSYTAAAIGLSQIPQPGPTTASLTVCAFQDTDLVIDDHNNQVSTTFTRAGAIPTPVQNGAGCKLLPLRYNGSTMEIFTINPGSNTTQRSFVRLTNRSQTDGYVSLEGIDNAGVRGASQVRVWVSAGESVQLDAADLENGTNGAIGAWGAPTDGKWRAVVTAEFPGLVATSLVNSALPRVLTNVTDSDTRGEQIGRDFNEGTWGNTPGERPADFDQEFEPDFHGNGSQTGEPGGPDGSDGPSGGQSEAPGNPGVGNP